MDYEIYGNGTGGLDELVYKPAESLASAFLKQGATFVVFPEVLELLKIDEYNTDPSIEKIKEQLRGFFEAGFEIGLHVHSWWIDARHENGQWLFDWGARNLCALPSERIDNILRLSIQHLRTILDSNSFTPSVFRNGLWVMQPTEPIARALARNGIRADSTVFKGGRIKDVGVNYGASIKNPFYWQFTADINTPDPAGILYEVPIFTELVPFWRMFGRLVKREKKAAVPHTSAVSSQSRFSDFARVFYPRKLDFCHMKFDEMKASVDRVLRQDRLSPEIYKPVVAIGHTKDLSNKEPVVRLLDYLNGRAIKVTNFQGFLTRMDMKPCEL